MAMLGVGGNSTGCARVLQCKLHRALAWGVEHGVQFDANKKYFHRTRQHEPTLWADDTAIEPNNTTKQLGVFFDRKLLFQVHLRRVGARAKIIARHINRLARTT